MKGIGRVKGGGYDQDVFYLSCESFKQWNFFLKKKYHFAGVSRFWESSENGS